jgi:hypothetical protein
MTRIVVRLVIPFTFSDEGEYQIRLSGRTCIVKIIHVKNTEGIDKTKGMHIHGSPKIVPDDPQGLYYISEVEVSMPLLSTESSNDRLMNEGLVSYVCMKYLNRLTEVIRFTTHRYWIKMITLRDIDIFKVNVENAQGPQPSLTKILGYPEGFIFEPLAIYEQANKKELINKILQKSYKLPLSENLLFDSLNKFHSGNFSEAIIMINISLEVFVEEFLTERFIAEGKSETSANQLVDELFDGKFHKTMRKAFFDNMSEIERANHHIWVKFENIRAKRKHVTHPHTKIPSYEETYQVFLDVVSTRDWILSLFYKDK